MRIRDPLTDTSFNHFIAPHGHPGLCSNRGPPDRKHEKTVVLPFGFHSNHPKIRLTHTRLLFALRFPFKPLKKLGTLQTTSTPAKKKTRTQPSKANSAQNQNLFHSTFQTHQPTNRLGAQSTQAPSACGSGAIWGLWKLTSKWQPGASSWVGGYPFFRVLKGKPKGPPESMLLGSPKKRTHTAHMIDGKGPNVW